MKALLIFAATLIVLFFMSGILLSSPEFADYWHIYEHDLTTEDLNFIGTEGYFAVGDNGVVLYCGYPTSSSYDPEWYDISPATSEDLYGVACDDNAHEVASKDDQEGIKRIEEKIDELAAQVWGLTKEELKEIRLSWLELGR